MGEVAFTILCLLAEPPDGSPPAKGYVSAKTLSEIIKLDKNGVINSESTAYKNMQTLLNYELVDYGINVGRFYTYYITQDGLDFVSRA